MIFFHWAIVMAGFGNEIGEFDLFLYIQFNNWYLTSILVFHALLYDTPINFLRQGLISLNSWKMNLFPSFAFPLVIPWCARGIQKISAQKREWGMKHFRHRGDRWGMSTQNRDCPTFSHNRENFEEFPLWRAFYLKLYILFKLKN